ncbi:MAG: hypothetical protein ACRC1H_20180, partial [Caldilineaceae bacterium]
MSHSPQPLSLDADALLGDRPFTHPNLTLQDLRTLHQSVCRLRAALHANVFAGDGPMTTWSWDDDRGNSQRIFVRDGVNLRALPRLYVVGFFGQRRPDADRLRMEGVDQALVDDMAHEHSKIVCYYTAALDSGEYGNMVLSSCDSARDEWNGSLRHATAVRELAPRYYRSVRLHNGLLEDGLLSAAVPVINVTKYFDYGHERD